MVLARHTQFNYSDIERALNMSVGFDSIFTRLFGEFEVNSSTNYPPYNIVKDGENEFTIEMAVAGFSKEDLEAELKEGVLTVRSKPTKDEVEYLHHGIAKRSFMRSFTLSDDVVVKDADLVNGMLTISLEKIIPDEKKPRLIPIGSNSKVIEQ